MTHEEAGAESSGRRLPHAGWIAGGVLLLAAAGVFWLWPRPIRVRLSDGTTLTVAAVTVGTEHVIDQPPPQYLLGVQVRGGVRWPTRKIRTFPPATLLWVENWADLERYDLLLVDRHGWRWKELKFSAGGFTSEFPTIDVDDELRLIVLDRSGELRGEALLPVTRVESPSRRGVPSPMRRPDLMPASGEAPPLPVVAADGPLTATLKAVEMTVAKDPVSQCHVRLDLETLWNGKPFPREFGFVTIIDERGRAQNVKVEPDGRFSTTFSPLATTWDLHVQVLRGPGATFEPEDTVMVTPELAEGAPFALQDGAIEGREWRVVLIPSGTLSLPLRYVKGMVRFSETIPVLFAEAETMLKQRVKLEPLDAAGQPLPVEKVNTNGFPGNIHAIGCPTFDPAKGHRVRALFNVARQVKFSIRPDVASASERGAAP